MSMRTSVLRLCKAAVVTGVGAYLMFGTHPVTAGVAATNIRAKQTQALNATQPVPLWWGGFLSSAAGGALAGSVGSPWGALAGAVGGGIAYAGVTYFDNGSYDAHAAAAQAAYNNATNQANQACGAYYQNYYDTYGVVYLSAPASSLD